MSAYGYYRDSRGYGTNQFQFGRPPTPDYRPNPNWGGLDFYQAHSHNADPSLFHNAWARVRDYSVDLGGLGVGMHEARHWHKRIYGGMGDPLGAQPSELGHAAAYEAYRTWLHNNSFYEPLRGDRQRQREGLIGLAVGEVVRLLQQSGRGYDHYARTIATEAAAATAAALFHQNQEEDYNQQYQYGGRSRSLHRYGGDGSYSPDPYAYDDEVYRGSQGIFNRGRSRSRHGSRRHHSHSRGPPSMYDDVQSGIPIPGSAMSMGGMGGAPGMMPSYSSSSYGSYGGGLGYGTAGSIPVQMGQMGPYGQPIGGVSYVTSGGMPMQIPGVPSSHRHRSQSMSYVQPPGYGMAPGMYGGQPQTIVITQPSRHKHRHGRSRSRHHRRSRSSDSDGHISGQQLAIGYPMSSR